MNKIKLILVDDQELIRESLAFVLSTDKEIDIVGLAANGEEAILLSEKHEPDMVLMDIQMPIMDGIEATKRLKQLLPNIKVVILTTFQEMDQIVEALSSGAEGYLLKAIHPKELISGIKYIFHNGTLLSQDVAMALVDRAKNATGTQSNKKTEARYELTEREQQIIQLLANGLSNRQISERLFLSEGTVKNYVSSIYQKLDVKDRFGAITRIKEDKLNDLR